MAVSALVLFLYGCWRKTDHKASALVPSSVYLRKIYYRYWSRRSNTEDDEDEESISKESKNYAERREESIRIDVNHLLGEGHFGLVYIADVRNIFGPEPTKVVVKKPKKYQDKDQLYAFTEELRILSSLDMHPNLVNLLGACTEEQQFYLLLEYCTEGDLRQFLHRKRPDFEWYFNNPNSHTLFKPSLLFYWSFSIAKGLDYLSSKNIMHGDLAARNILVRKDYNVMISDFGLSKEITEEGK